MPLSSIRAPAEEEQFDVHFLMQQGETLVDCFVDEAAIDNIDEPKLDGEPLVDRFDRHRKMFEHIASWLFDEGELEPWIEARHVAKFSGSH